MSWLSEGLKKVGISKEVQRAITKPLATATLGPVGAFVPVAKPAQTAAANIPAVISVKDQAANTPQDQAGAILQGFQAIMRATQPQPPAAPTPPGEPEKKTNWLPFALAGAGVLVLGLGAALAFRK